VKPQQMEGQTTMLAVHPRTGEAIDLHAAATDELLECHDAFADLVREMRDAQREVDDVLIERMDHEGRRSFTFSDFKIDVTPPTEKEWNVDALQQTLANLVGRELLSMAKAERCVKAKYEPVWRELKTLLSDPRVKDHIEACFTEVPARRYVKVSRR
jgi:hypothetical protein